MEPVQKQLACPSCGETVKVRVDPEAANNHWHCPKCHKLQISEQQAVAAAPPG
jgi:predicted RNA-binding Zn-ribbon protein involved in translation (DUF1610 family)